jgi:hypothetical protein
MVQVCTASRTFVGVAWEGEANKPQGRRAIRKDRGWLLRMAVQLRRWRQWERPSRQATPDAI